jgi:hypothetical protein
MYLKEFKVWLIIEDLGVLENETCYKTGCVSTCNFMVVKGCAACLEAKIILGPDLSQGRTCPSTLRQDLSRGPALSKNFGAGGFQKLQGRKCLAAGSVQRFRAGSVLWPEMSQSLGPEVSRGRT